MWVVCVGCVQKQKSYLCFSISNYCFSAENLINLQRGCMLLLIKCHSKFVAKVRFCFLINIEVVDMRGLTWYTPPPPPVCPLAAAWLRLFYQQQWSSSLRDSDCLECLGRYWSKHQYFNVATLNKHQFNLQQFWPIGLAVCMCISYQ